MSDHHTIAIIAGLIMLGICQLIDRRCLLALEIKVSGLHDQIDLLCDELNDMTITPNNDDPDAPVRMTRNV